MVESKSKQGALVTYKGATPIGRDAWKDDGATLASDVTLGRLAMKVEIDRGSRKATTTIGEKTIERDIPEGAIVLENGDWQAYAIAASWFHDARAPKPVKVMLPSQDLALDGTIQVEPAADGATKVTIAIASLVASAIVGPDGVVQRAEVPKQGLVVLKEGAPPPVLATRAAPASVVDESFAVESESVAIKGSLWIPKDAKTTPPLVVMIAGSGPTDREGNSALGLSCDAYRMLAEALAAKGIATLRYDKRGVGESGMNFDPATLTLDDFVNDARAVVGQARASGRFASVAVLGHSEGGVVAIELAKKTPIDALVLVATPGRPLDAVLHEQLSTKLDAHLLADADRMVAAVKAGQSPDPVPPALAPLFNRNVRSFLRSIFAVDPSAELAKLKVKTAIVLGDHDAQVSLADAKALAHARPDAKTTIVPNMSHVLKEDPSPKLPQASYTDPKMQLAPGLVDAVAAAVAK